MNNQAVTYGLSIAAFGDFPFVEIDQETFEEARDAKRVIFDALGNEESFNLILGNYLEFEMALLGGAIELLIYDEGRWSEFTGRIYDVNRRTLNLLSGCRAYLDQTAHYISRSFGDESEELESFRKWTATEYDADLGYRAMEALRNYVQHRGIAIHRLTHQLWREDVEGVRRNALVPLIYPQRFSEDGGFKSSVAQELAEIGEAVDLRPLVKDYVVGLARVHDQLRAHVANHVANAERAVLALIDRYRETNADDITGLAAVKRDSEGRWIERIALFADPIERRQTLVRAMRRVQYLAKVYTTNEPKK